MQYPAEEYIEISLGSHSVNKGLQPLVQDDIEIYDVLGNVVRKFNSVAFQTPHRSVSTSAQIDISHLPVGTYFVKVYQDGRVVDYKFVKM